MTVIKQVITLPTPHTFLEALTKLKSGECLGIRPAQNTAYLVPFIPSWMGSGSRTEFMLSWNHWDEAQLSETSCRVSQLLGEWFLVVADHRYL